MKLITQYLACQYVFGENTILVPIFWGHSQFSPCYFQFAINLVPTINSLTENAYVANDVYSWHN